MIILRIFLKPQLYDCDFKKNFKITTIKRDFKKNFKVAMVLRFLG